MFLSNQACRVLLPLALYVRILVFSVPGLLLPLALYVRILVFSVPELLRTAFGWQTLFFAVPGILIVVRIIVFSAPELPLQSFICPPLFIFCHILIWALHCA